MKLSESDWERYIETQSLIREAAEDRMQAWLDQEADEWIAESYHDINDVPQWVAYRLEERNGRFTKVPVNPRTGGYAQTNNPATWGTLEQAQRAASKYGTNGVGFVFANGYYGIDLDHVIDPETKMVKKYAQDIVDTMASYAEVSPSGTGIHIIAYGSPAFETNVNRKLGIEMYCPTLNDDGTINRGRYFTVTGNTYGSVLPISARTEEAEEIWRRYIDGKPVFPDDFISADKIKVDDEDAAMADFAYGLTTQYGEASAALSCEMYDALAEAQGAHVPPAEPAATATYDETARAVWGTMKNRRNSVPDTVGRLVKQAGADTTVKNALRDGAEFAWVPHGDTCAFCLMLGSNGWRRASKEAIKYGHAEHIHAHCDCEYAVRFDGRSTIKGYDPEKLLEQYENADGNRWQDKVNSLRREQYKVDKDKINEQKRIAYRERKSKEGESSPIVTNTPKKPEKPTYGHRDVTKEWLQTATPNSHEVQDVTAFTQDGVTYTVDGNNVKLDYSPHEKEIAELLESKLGGEIWMMPRVDKPENIRTPDYLLRGERLDLKTMKKSTSRNAVYNTLNDSERQASNFVLDISNNQLGRDEILRQAGEIFQSYHMRFVHRLIIVENGDIVQIMERE